MQHCPAPLVLHLTGGEYTKSYGDPEPIAQQIMAMSVPDGPVLIGNIFISDDVLPEPIADPRAWPGILPDTPLASPHAEKLRAMSSPLPESYRRMMAAEGYRLTPGSLMLLPGTAPELVVAGLGFQIAGVTGVEERPLTEPESQPPILPLQVEISQMMMTAYYPKEVNPLVWHPLHAYIFRESAAFQVDADARERLGERINEYRRLSKTARRPIAKGSTITAIPRLGGFQFNPPSQTVELHEDWHRLDFRLRARPELVGTASNGLLTFTVEGVIVADIPISIYVGDRPMTAEMVNAPGRPYRSIFCSYSRRDTCVVKHVERAYKTLGIDYLRDVVSLRSGEPWQPALLSMIERADIFQLFWSRNAVRSKYVEDEWRYALRLGREPSRFIRPVYWTEPMPPPPPDLEHLSFAFVPELASLLWRFVSHAYRLVARLTSRSPVLSNERNETT
jgi:hypothetical protein